MPDRNDEELIIRGPVLVPMGWIVAIFGASGTAVLMAFSLGIGYATLSSKQEAMAKDVNKIDSLVLDVNTIKTMLQYKFPDAAAVAKQQALGH